MVDAGFVLPSWFVSGALAVLLGFLILGLYYAAHKILHIELQHLYHLIKTEWEDSRSKKFTVGAMNWKGFIALILFSFVAFIFTSSQKLVGIIGAALGSDKVAELVKATDFITVVYFLAAYMLCSLLAVIADKKTGGK